ncbi:MAG: hypothetical protein ABI597_11260 [Gammaproteobacteria bacterium]
MTWKRISKKILFWGFRFTIVESHQSKIQRVSLEQDEKATPNLTKQIVPHTLTDLHGNTLHQRLHDIIRNLDEELTEKFEAVISSHLPRQRNDKHNATRIVLEYLEPETNLYQFTASKRLPAESRAALELLFSNLVSRPFLTTTEECQIAAMIRLNAELESEAPVQTISAAIQTTLDQFPVLKQKKDFAANLFQAIKPLPIIFESILLAEKTTIEAQKRGSFHAGAS